MRTILISTFLLYAAVSNGQLYKTEPEYRQAIVDAHAAGKDALADSLSEVAVKQFPKGDFAKVKACNELNRMQGTATEKMKAYEKWVADFPEPEGGGDIIYDYARSGVAWGFLQEKDKAQDLLWISRIKDGQYRSMIEVYHGESYLEEKDTTTAEALIRSGVADAKVSYPTSRNPMAKSDYYRAVSTLAMLLYKERKFSEALEYATIAYNEGDKKSNPAITKSYALALSSNGKAEEALTLLSDLTAAGDADNEVRNYLKPIYIKAKGSDKGYDAFTDKLTADMFKHFQEKLGKEILSEAAPAFTLKDLEGNTVSLASLKGKIVIVDFWATWCGPCKRSFPAMKQALTKYKKDSNVQFLFVDTWERVADASKDVKKFMDDNKYPFHVLLDDEKKVVGQFNVKGIPAKFIIDGKGNIRFKLTGFSGGDDAAVAELSAMIEMARKG